MRLKGRRAVVTGGGRGIGRAIALAFAKEGADVAVLARTQTEIESVAAEVEALGVRGFAVRCEVGNSRDVETAMRAAGDYLGSVDILVANAGMMKHASVCETSDEMWDETMRVNLNSVFWSSRAVVDAMSKIGWGRIIVMSSVSGKVGGANRSAYHAAKHGVIGFARSLALEVAGDGVTVNTICPGFVDTKMVADAEDDFVRYAGNGRSAKETLEMFRQSIPMGRFLDPTEIAAMALYLASDDAKGVTGQAFTISCGSVQA
ncbi:MAG: SDR family oxidoreductase [Nitrospinaceae bacterium]|jgi:meso-butanediol dehydrogenase / (S,S)-butanediol dehydrogenase / diacetyl reductase|nr:SDR family oxidoreductase [Nitrospinaceae bacterium]MBT3822654.1 SDR family oxidoreductase [Nitrospinaceae bacterium]MBT4093451.1 SDR family oxidoreductase [Nitrospinaceae bacterium]MBT4432603.1 SDR family oxidoreductase [Nitrospinaceae bacterium]MBT5367427.1 SDR family oxidoreductase [Nitrospinaceae bacterium]